MRASGISMPVRVNKPWRNITRRSVITKCVVHHVKNGQRVNQQMVTSQIARITSETTVLAVCSHPSELT
jgi:hypothetical protein